MEIIIIGAGPGGYAAALYAAKRGIKVTLIEKGEVGGTCLNRGCIPTKALLHSAGLYHRLKSAADLGIKLSVEGFDYAQMRKRSDGIVSKLRGGVEFLLKKAGVSMITGTASIIGGGQVSVASKDGEQTLRADKIIIATGSAPTDIPAAPADGHMIMNSDHALELYKLPESLAIIGGGVIGCEFAQAFARLGCEVTIIELAPQLLPGVDADISALLFKALKNDGVQIYLNARATNIYRTESGVSVEFSAGQGKSKLSAQKLLAATGRKPNLAWLENTGIEQTDGFININAQMQTNIPGIYAVGDVTGGIQLAHTASFGGITAVKHILGEHAEFSSCVPMCVYTEPEIASAGLTYDAARQAGFNCRTGVFPLSANPRAVIEGAADGFAKTVLDEDGTIIGAHLAGPNATEMISLIGGLINFQTAASDMAEIIFAHPSFSEIIPESVAAADKMALHI